VTHSRISFRACICIINPFNLIDRVTLHIRLVVGCHARHLWKSALLDDEREQNHILVAHPGPYNGFYFGKATRKNGSASLFNSFVISTTTKNGFNSIFPPTGQFDFLSAHCLGAPVKAKIIRFCRDTQVQVQVSFYHSRKKVLSLYCLGPHAHLHCTRYATTLFT